MQLAVLGNPVSRSKSPLIHAAALRSANIPGRYRAICLDEDGMDRVAGWVRSGRMTGANITMPHKGVAARLADTLTPPAHRSLSVNTWVGRNGLLEGHSTDGDGVRYAWRRNALPADGPVLVLGSGGVAAAALLALEDRDLHVSARNPEKAHRLIEILGIRAPVLPWGSGVDSATVVNATPIGSAGEALGSQVLDRASGLLEMVYGSAPTPSELIMRARGAPVAPGIDMLIGQAMASFRLWTNHEPDELAMWSCIAPSG